MMMLGREGNGEKEEERKNGCDISFVWLVMVLFIFSQFLAIAIPASDDFWEVNLADFLIEVGGF